MNSISSVFGLNSWKGKNFIEVFFSSFPPHNVVFGTTLNHEIGIDLTLQLRLGYYELFCPALVLAQHSLEVVKQGLLSSHIVLKYCLHWNRLGERKITLCFCQEASYWSLLTKGGGKKPLEK